MTLNFAFLFICHKWFLEFLTFPLRLVWVMIYVSTCDSKFIVKSETREFWLSHEPQYPCKSQVDFDSWIWSFEFRLLTFSYGFLTFLFLTYTFYFRLSTVDFPHSSFDKVCMNAWIYIKARLRWILAKTTFTMESLKLFTKIE